MLRRLCRYQRRQPRLDASRRSHATSVSKQGNRGHAALRHHRRSLQPVAGRPVTIPHGGTGRRRICERVGVARHDASRRPCAGGRCGPRVGLPNVTRESSCGHMQRSEPDASRVATRSAASRGSSSNAPVARVRKRSLRWHDPADSIGSLQRAGVPRHSRTVQVHLPDWLLRVPASVAGGLIIALTTAPELRPNSAE